MDDFTLERVSPSFDNFVYENDDASSEVISGEVTSDEGSDIIVDDPILDEACDDMSKTASSKDDASNIGRVSSEDQKLGSSR